MSVSLPILKVNVLNSKLVSDPCKQFRFCYKLDPKHMVFRWGHSRSRASPFYIKIKTRDFHMKTSNVSEIYWF